MKSKSRILKNFKLDPKTVRILEHESKISGRTLTKIVESAILDFCKTEKEKVA